MNHTATGLRSIEGQAPPSLTRVTGDNPAAISGFLSDGGLAVILTSPARHETTMMLDRVLEDVDGTVLRIGNPLKAPLSISRLLLQIGGEVASDDEAAALRRAVSERAKGVKSLVLAIDDAHTLTPDALLALARLIEPVDQEWPAWQLILAGRPAVLIGLPGAGFEIPAETLMVVELGEQSGPLEGPATPGADVHDARISLALTRPTAASEQVDGRPDQGQTAPVVPEEIDVPAIAAQPVSVRQILADRPPSPSRAPLLPRLHEVGLGTALLALIAAGLLMLSAPDPSSSTNAAASVAGATRTPQVAQGPVPAVTSERSVASDDVAPTDAPSSPAPDRSEVARTAALPAESEGLLAGISESQMRADFGVFLHRAGYAVQTPAAQEALFEEYKEWLARNMSGSAPGLAR